MSAVELATRLVEFLKAGKCADAVAEFVTEATVIEVPGMVFSSTHKGKAKILKEWTKQFKDGMKPIKEPPFTSPKPGVAVRRLTVDVKIMNIDLNETITFKDGKLVTMILKKA